VGIVGFALRFPHTFYVVAALIVFLGGVAIRAMPADIFPEIKIPVVTVNRRGHNHRSMQRSRAQAP
jgi:multidrug efflux pump subunit AcrB